jgi:hypothetical protein
VIRPVLLFGVSPKERAEETGMSKSSIYYKANLFDQAGMASLFPPTPPPVLLYQHPYQSPQLPLWPPGEVEWHVIMRVESKVHRRKRMVKSLVIQPPLPIELTETQ